MSKELTKRLKDFHNSLPSVAQQVEFRRILDDFAAYYFDAGEVFKQTVIELIPGKIQQPGFQVNQQYKPAKKQTGDPLTELLAGLSPDEQTKLREKLENK